VKKILITGAGSGLGRGSALGLAEAGHDVIATTQIWPQVTELRRHVADLGLQDRITVDKLESSTPATSWRRRRGLRHVRQQRWLCRERTDGGDPVELVRRTFETNVFSNLELTQHVVRKFVDEQIAGASSSSARWAACSPPTASVAYCASKHALEESLPACATSSRRRASRSRRQSPRLRDGFQRPHRRDDLTGA